MILLSTEKWSFPKERIIQTKHAKPSLASQAAKVNNTNKINNSASELWKINIKPKVKITPSSANNDMSMWRRWITKVINDDTVISLIDADPKTNII